MPDEKNVLLFVAQTQAEIPTGRLFFSTVGSQVIT